MLGAGAELCDLCGSPVAPETVVSLQVPDSSAVTDDEHLDGIRLLRACTREHLARLAAAYQLRPFAAEELWAGQIVRALRRLGPADDDLELYDRLIQATGLDDEQMLSAANWQERTSHGRGFPG